MPHEKQGLQTVRRLRAILSPPKDAAAIEQLHEQDERTKWFGVVRELTGRPILEDYGRYATLMCDVAARADAGVQYPQLVSFIGVTNAGKSSLIKMLIQHDGNRDGDSDYVAFPSPVVGSILHESVPTSGDVHLYADPSTHRGQLPILYADCEGFEGGENVPLGSLPWTHARRRSGAEEGSVGPIIQTRLIQWAGTQEARRREYAVTALYPRLLYTFSDCVVYVLRNPKTFQSRVLTKLLDWGATAMEKSVNQPALPHCVVVLNDSDPRIHEREWDADFATQSLLSTVEGAFDYAEGVPRFRELASHWRRLGRHIYTVEDLILRYYSSFKVVRIPAKPKYEVMDDQLGKLHAVIRENCEKSFRAKNDARMLIGADELNVYLQSGFDHFTAHLDAPFNFMQVSLMRNPIPSDFGGHVLRLWATVSARSPSRSIKAVGEMFQQSIVMLASCVLLDCARFRKGRLNELFAGYERFFDEAMAEFLELHCPCSYTSPDRSRACVLVRARHLAKDHQDEQGIIAAGNHIAAFDRCFTKKWKEQLRAAIEGLERDFAYEVEQAPTESHERVALDLHLENINHFYDSVGPAFIHETCLCCVMNAPQHVLPCGHLLCDRCVQGYGKRRKWSVRMDYCPLHRQDSQWNSPATIQYKPAGAGVRILSLDGGGIRSVVQLEILRAIENDLGGDMPVQKFFDLMVGTGTGGLVAVALQMEGQTLERFSNMFPSICEHTYVPRLNLTPKSETAPRSKGVALLTQIVRAFSPGPRYKTEPLYAALRKSFTGQHSFFGSSRQFAPGAKVAVTAASAVRGDVMVFTNYKCPQSSDAEYTSERTHEPSGGLKTWECVAATMAYPPYFEPFKSHNGTYLDGGVGCINPVYMADGERKRLWPDVREPDIFLSLGSGQQRKTIAEKLRDGGQEINSLHSTSSPNGAAVVARNMGRRWQLGTGDDVLEAERKWRAFKAMGTQKRLHRKGLIRINPDLGEDPPSQDCKDQVRTLQIRVRQMLEKPHRRIAVGNVAQRLVATAFYLDVHSQVMDEEGAQVASGSVACRFEDGSVELRAFGNVLKHRLKPDFNPYFLIRPAPCSRGVPCREAHARVTITEEKVKRMVDDAVFEQPKVLLRLGKDLTATSINLFLSPGDGLEPEGYPISGFPCGIVQHSSDRTSHAWPQEAGRAGQGDRCVRESSTSIPTDFSKHPALRRQPVVSSGGPNPLARPTGSDSPDVPRPTHWSATDTTDEAAEVSGESHDAAHRSLRNCCEKASCTSLDASAQSRNARLSAVVERGDGEQAPLLDGPRPAQLGTTSTMDTIELGSDHKIVTPPLGLQCDLTDNDSEFVFDDDVFFRGLVEKDSPATSVGDWMSAARGSCDSNTLNSSCVMYMRPPTPDIGEVSVHV